MSWREWALGFADALPPRECAALLQLRIGGELYCRDRPARPQRRNDKARGVKGFMEYRGCEGAQHTGPMVLCRYKHDEPLSSP